MTVLVGAVAIGAWPAATALDLPGAQTDYWDTPDHASYTTTDLDVRARIAPDVWDAAAAFEIASQWDAAPNKRWYFGVTNSGTTGRLFVGLSVNGTASIFKTPTTDVAGTDGQYLSVRMTVDVDNGASGYDVKSWKSTDSNLLTATWTQVGATVTTATAITLADSAAPLRVGRHGEIASVPMNGKVIAFMLMDSIGGTAVASFDATRVGRKSSLLPTTYNDPQGHAWTAHGTGWSWLP